MAIVSRTEVSQLIGTNFAGMRQLASDGASDAS